MKIGDRDTPGSRIYAEREFKESAQVLVATEAAGEGINLQFCWLMINFDIPWNPVRLEQRVGRIHRYGQEKDCLVFNFVARNTREGRILAKLLERLAEIRRELGTDQVFDVVGEVMPANLLEKLFRDMYALLPTDPALEWVTPGHPLFEALLHPTAFPRPIAARSRNSSTTNPSNPGSPSPRRIAWPRSPALRGTSRSAWAP